MFEATVSGVFYVGENIEVRLGGVLTALIAAIVVPGFLSSQFHGSQPSGALNGAERAVTAFKLVRDDHGGYTREQGISSPPLHNQLTAK